MKTDTRFIDTLIQVSNRFGIPIEEIKKKEPHGKLARLARIEVCAILREQYGFHFWKIGEVLNLTSAGASYLYTRYLELNKKV